MRRGTGGWRPDALPSRGVRACAVRRQGRRRQPGALGLGGTDPKADQRTDWLLATVTPEFVRALLPEAADLEVEVHPLPEPPGGERGHPGAARAGRRGEQPVRPAGEGAGRMGPVAARRHPGGAPVTFWSAEQEALRASARTFVEREVLPHLQRWEDEQVAPPRAAPQGGQAGFPRRLVPRGGRRGRWRAARLRGAHRGADRGGRLRRAGRRTLHARHRAAAHRGERQRRPRRPVRPADARRRADRRAGDHRARRRIRRGEHPDDGGARRRPLRRQRRQDLHHLRRAGRLRDDRRADRRAGSPGDQPPGRREGARPASR